MKIKNNNSIAIGLIVFSSAMMLLSLCLIVFAGINLATSSIVWGIIAIVGYTIMFMLFSLLLGISISWLTYFKSKRIKYDNEDK